MNPYLHAARILAINIALWTAMCAVGALGTYSDGLRQGMDRPYAVPLWNWWSTHALMMLFSSGVYLLLSHRPALLGHARRIAAVYMAVLLLFLPLELIYVAGVFAVRAGAERSLQAAWQELHRMHKFDWFMEMAWTTFTYIAVVAVRTWHQGRTREQAWRQAQTDNLTLRLELEQQRLLALRSQLEPHFLFNALNAISALVRSDDKRVALSGISRLSDLLRYALSASTRDWVSMADELQFVRDYLALQGLRYGDRLRFSVEGDHGAVLGADCPPLLLQPLVENALRHDLDCHDGSSDIHLRLSCEDGQLVIRISNPLPALVSSSGEACTSPNPGLGLGLASTRARLQMAAGNAATLRTRQDGGRFVAEVRMPMEHAA
ncbi:histidine kinase [Pseudoduganella sp. LjRoot289]|uniref:sensor histidine kinase n=1 Tax=Pseudoduganella sp. LjRoot289 TaxID=3342314 RepID=UPI003ED035C0